jgi:hypothetical protein
MLDRRLDRQRPRARATASWLANRSDIRFPARLEGRTARGLGLVENLGDGQRQGKANAWRLTGRGRECLRSVWSRAVTGGPPGVWRLTAKEERSARTARVARNSACKAREVHDRRLRGVVWSAALLFCLLVRGPGVRRSGSAVAVVGMPDQCPVDELPYLRTRADGVDRQPARAAEFLRIGDREQGPNLFARPPASPACSWMIGLQHRRGGVLTVERELGV